jgi:hypothetical protein
MRDGTTISATGLRLILGRPLPARSINGKRRRSIIEVPGGAWIPVYWPARLRPSQPLQCYTFKESINGIKAG